MSIDNNISFEAAGLRRRAEDQLKVSEACFPRTNDETERLFHELQVHQIELEMQNAELRQARDETEKTLEMYTDLYDFAPVGYCTIDRSGIILAANFSMTSMFGVERSKLIGRSFGLSVAEGSLAVLAGFLIDVFAGNGKGSCELELSTEKNYTHFVRLDAFACMSGQECNVAVIDITGRRNAEIQLRTNKQQLEELNGTLEEKIARAVEDLRLKDQMLILQDRRAVMGEMINYIAHQWRQPLNLLGIYIQELLIFYDSGEFSRELLEDDVNKGMIVIQQMSQTIDDFSNFFRPDKQAVAFSINQVIAETVSLIERNFLVQDITINLNHEGNPTANGYPNQYAQVVMNILKNACDAFDGKNHGNNRITIQTCVEGGRSVATISDNAGGIDDKILDRLFEPYFTTKTPDKGSGIGLFMSRAIIDRSMGGRLTVRNIDSGAEFRIEV